MYLKAHNKISWMPFILWPSFLWLLVFMILPMAILIVISLGFRDELGRVVFGFNLANYTRFFSGPYLNVFLRSIWLAVGTTGVCLILGFCCAWWLAFCVPKERQNLYMMLLIAPLWTSFLLRIYAWMIILRPTGCLNGIFDLFGMVHHPVFLYTPSAVLLGMVYNYLPFMVLPLYAALGKLNKQYLEAAADLGATACRTFAKITLPLSLRGIVAGVTMVFVPSLGEYVTPDLLGGSKQMYIGNLIQNQFLVVRDWAFGSAVSTILIVIVAVFVCIYIKYGDNTAI